MSVLCHNDFREALSVKVHTGATKIKKKGKRKKRRKVDREMDSTDENCSAAAEANGGESTVDLVAGH